MFEKEGIDSHSFYLLKKKKRMSKKEKTRKVIKVLEVGASQ